MDFHKKAEKFWDRSAKSYDREERGDEHVLLKIIDKIKNNLKSSDTVLDFGCGTGLVSNKLSNHVKSIKGVDISSKMLEIAKIKALKNNIKNIEYAHTTIFDKRFNTESFDVVFAFYILHLLESPQEVVDRLSELIKPGGLLISTTPCLGEKKLLKGVFSIGSKLGLFPKVNSFRYSELQHLLEKGNFEIIETECLNLKTQEYFIVAKKK